MHRDDSLEVVARASSRERAAPLLLSLLALSYTRTRTQAQAHSSQTEPDREGTFVLPSVR